METLILIILWWLSCVLCALGGYFYARNKRPEAKEFTEKEKNDALKKKREYENFLSYDGSEQERF